MLHTWGSVSLVIIASRGSLFMLIEGFIYDCVTVASIKPDGLTDCGGGRLSIAEKEP